MKKLLLFVSLLWSTVCFSGYAPIIAYSDLLSGPNSATGMDSLCNSNTGTIVTLYGYNFGSSQGGSSVSINGNSSASAICVYDWGTLAPRTSAVMPIRKIVVQLGSSATDGNITVTTSDGTSNGIAFDVRTASIYCVATTGNSGNSGTCASPKSSPLQLDTTVIAGSIIYIKNGVSITANDGRGWNAAWSIETTFQGQDTGTSTEPIAYVAYPGATVTVGARGSTTYGLRYGNGANWYTFVGITFDADSAGVDSGSTGVTTDGIRFIANKVSAANHSSQLGCFTINETTGAALASIHNQVMGNEITNCGTAASDKQDHSLYLTTNANGVEVGYNYIHDNTTCYGSQIHSSDGNNNYYLYYHHNIITNQNCAGINFATLQPQTGEVLFYNNIIGPGVGTSGASSGGGGDLSCIYGADITNFGSNGSGTVHINNNTFYGCGTDSFDPIDNAAFANTYVFNFKCNIDYKTTTTGAYTAGDATKISGDKNEFFGDGNGPAAFTNNLNSDPLFTNAGTGDYSLTTSSPGKSGCTNDYSTFDFNGVPIPEGGNTAYGAFQYASGAGGASFVTNGIGAFGIGF